MDQMDFEWFNKNKDNIDTPEVLDALVNQFSQNNSAANEISSASTGELIEYLLQGNPLENNYAPLNLMMPPPPTITTTTDTTAGNKINNSSITGGNFFTFVSTSSNSTPPKKKDTKEKSTKNESIFVTESPQTMYNKKSSNNSNKKSTQHSSGGEDIGSDDDMFEEIRSSSSYKMMTSKEKRQLRNKISARNFRVRRKEYITQLEEKVQNHEDTIDILKEENGKLRKANEELMQQLLNQSITPPPSSNETSPPSSFSSNSPESIPGSTIPNNFQFPFDDLYEFNLFDIPPPNSNNNNINSNTTNITVPVNDSLFINHMSVPAWNITKTLDNKQQDTIFSSYEAIYDDAKELIQQYPLLAPALMSIVLRHTLSLEYVQSYAKELQENGKMSNTTTKTKKKSGIEYINHVEDTGEKAEEEELTDEEISHYMLNYSFTRYVAYRIGGFSHQDVIKRAKHCMKGHIEEVRQMMQNKKEKKQESKKKKEEFELKKNTLYTYCQVAGKLLKNPERMAHIGSVIKQTQTENYRRQNLNLPKQIGGSTSGMNSLASSLRNLRISKA